MSLEVRQLFKLNVRFLNVNVWLLFALQEMIKNIADEMNFHKKEVQILKSEKDTLQSVLSMKTQDVKKTLTSELMRIEEEMKRHFAH